MKKTLDLLVFKKLLRLQIFLICLVHNQFLVRYIKRTFLLITLLLSSCGGSEETSGTYVGPNIDRRGRFRKGYVRKHISTDVNAVKNRTRSKVYYHTKGKYRNR